MKLKSLIQVIGLFLLTSCAAFALEQPPNVVLIFADDLGYGDLGCYGATKVQTPNIDRLASEGRRFTDAHSVSAVCTPSRYALITGQYPVRANGGRGVWGPAPVTSPLIVDTERNTIADVFKSSGYETGVIGKWHLGFGEGRNDWQEPLRPGPQDLGFDYYFGMPVVNSAPPYVYVENDRVVGADPDDPLVYLGRRAKGVTPITPIPPEAANRSPTHSRERWKLTSYSTTIRSERRSRRSPLSGSQNAKTNLSFCIWQRPTFITRLLRPSDFKAPVSVDFMVTLFMNLTGSSARFFRVLNRTD